MSLASPLVLVIEDEDPLRKYLRVTLQCHDYQVAEAGTGVEGERLAKSLAPDVILLDLGLPDGDGLERVASLRAQGATPIIVVSARGREEDKVRALDLGADNYLSKPFGTSELLARIRVVLRHAAALSGAAPGPVLSFGPIRVDLSGRRVWKGDEEIHLSPNEYALFVALAQQAGKVMTHRQLLRQVWGGAASAQPQYLRVCMTGLRKKLEQDPARPRLLITEPGVGYRLKGLTES